MRTCTIKLNLKNVHSISSFEVMNGMEEQVKQAFRNRPKLVDNFTGFIRLEVLSSAEYSAQIWLPPFPLHRPMRLAGILNPYSKSYPDKVKAKVEITMKNGKLFTYEKVDYPGFFTAPFYIGACRVATLLIGSAPGRVNFKAVEIMLPNIWLTCTGIAATSAHFLQVSRH